MVVIPTLFLEHDGMDEQETLQRIGCLIAEARRHKYPSRRQFAFKSGVNIKTLMTAEKGAREISLGTQVRVEKALGWRDGSIGDVLRNRKNLDPDTVTVADMERGAPAAETDIVDLLETKPHWGLGVSDEELLAEVSYRLRNYKDETERPKAPVSNEP
jgi:transcriptional regulator with XRE-family HTH domain